MDNWDQGRLARANYIPGDVEVSLPLPPPSKHANFWTDRDAKLADLNRQVGSLAERINIADASIAEQTAALERAQLPGEKEAAQAKLDEATAMKVDAESQLAAVRAELEEFTRSKEEPKSKKAAKSEAVKPAGAQS